MVNTQRTAPDTRTVLPYGSWPTPVTSALVVRALVRHDDVAVADGATWWAELRPEGAIGTMPRRSHRLRRGLQPSGDLDVLIALRKPCQEAALAGR